MASKDLHKNWPIASCELWRVLSAFGTSLDMFYQLKYPTFFSVVVVWPRIGRGDKSNTVDYSQVSKADPRKKLQEFNSDAHFEFLKIKIFRAVNRLSSLVLVL